MWERDDPKEKASEATFTDQLLGGGEGGLRSL